MSSTGVHATTEHSIDTNKTSNKKNIKVVATTKIESQTAQSSKIKPNTSNVIVNVNTSNQQVTITTTAKPKPTHKVNKYDNSIKYAKAVKNNYVVGENIKIKFSLKKNAYIYFWTLSSNGKGYLILPNDFEDFNTYKKNKEYIVPKESADYQFISDRVGVEEVFLLSTSKPISKKQMLKIFSDKTSNVVPTAPKGNIQNFIRKDIIVIAKKEKFTYDVKSFQIGVRKAPKTAKPTTVTPVIIQTDGTKINIKIQ